MAKKITLVDNPITSVIKDTFGAIADTVGLSASKSKSDKPKKSVTSNVKKTVKKAVKKVTTATASAKKALAPKKSTKKPAKKKIR